MDESWLVGLSKDLVYAQLNVNYVIQNVYPNLLSNIAEQKKVIDIIFNKGLEKNFNYNEVAMYMANPSENDTSVNMSLSTLQYFQKLLYYIYSLQPNKEMKCLMDLIMK